MKLKKLSTRRQKCLISNPTDIAWMNLECRYKLPEEFIDHWVDRLDFDDLVLHQQLSERFMNHWADKLDWTLVSEYQRLSEEFINHWATRLNWGHLCVYQRLSAQLILQHLDKVDWYIIEEYYPQVYQTYNLRLFQTLTGHRYG